MARLLTFLLASLACAGATVASADDAFVTAGFALATGRPADATNNSTCGGVTFQFSHPSNKATPGTMLAVNVTTVDLPANASILFSSCSPGFSDSRTVVVSDPKTWLVSLPGPCVEIEQNQTSAPLDCLHKGVTIEYSTLSDFCKRSKTATVCAASANSTPASAATSMTTAAWSLAAAAIAASASTW